MKVGTDGVLLGAWAGVAGAGRVLDIGAGTGLLSLMIAQRAPAAEVHGVEIDEQSAQQAAENAAASPWADQVRIVHSSIQEFAKTCPYTYDLIISNPPFFRESLKPPGKERGAARHAENAMPHSDLLRAVRTMLAPQGRFCLILPVREARDFLLEATPCLLYATRVQEVCSRPGLPAIRALLELEKNSKPLQQSPVLAVESEAFRELTREFYL